MPKRKEPMLLNMRRSGLTLGFSLQGRKMTGLTMDYQEAAAAREVAQVVTMIDGVMSRREGYEGSPMGSILEGIACLDSGVKQPKGKGTTLVNLQSSGLKMGMVLREHRVTGLNIDYQDILGNGEVRELLKVLNGITSGDVYRKAKIIKTPLKNFSAVLAEDQETLQPFVEGHSAPMEPSDEIIVKAVDESLGILGAEGKRAFLGLLESKYGMRLTDVPDRPRGFVGLLKANLGPTADEVEREIVREIRNAAPVRGTSLQDVVESLKALGQEEKKNDAAQPEAETAADPVAPTTAVVGASPSVTGPLEDIPTLSLNYNVKGSPVEEEPEEETEEEEQKEN